MGFLGNHRRHMEAVQASDSVVALVGQMQAELRDLVTRREDLARRILHLRQVMLGLREISSAPTFNHPGAQPPSLAGYDSMTASVPANRTAVSPPGCHLQPSIPCKTDQVNVRLQRACRIALLEAEKPVSLEEICARIVRRGSFSFVNPEYANPFLLQVLNDMAEWGEVHLLESAACSRWERLALKKAQAPAVG